MANSKIMRNEVVREERLSRLLNWKRDYGLSYTCTQRETPTRPRSCLRATASQANLACTAKGFAYLLVSKGAVWVRIRPFNRLP